MTSRETSEAFIPCVPTVTPSETATVLNSIGVPPAARTPSLMCAASARRWKLHGIASVQVLAIPIVGRLSGGGAGLLSRSGGYRSSPPCLQAVQVAPHVRGVDLLTGPADVCRRDQ